MNETQEQNQGADVRTLIREAIQEFVRAEQHRTEPAYKTELVEERKRREHLERRVQELEQENRRSREAAEYAERSSTIRAELQRLGVTKVDLAFKAVKDEVQRGEDGRLVAKLPSGELALKDYLAQFVTENPELLPARISGGSGAAPSHKGSQGAPAVDLDKIRPGMSAEELDRVRLEISRVADQAFRGL